MDYLKERWLSKIGKAEPKVKVKKSIAKKSAKRKIQDKEYKKIIKDAVSKDIRCKVKSPVCTGFMQGFHHLQKRSPSNVLKKDNLIQCCNMCNGFIENNIEWAKNNGFFISRFKK